MTKSQNNKVSSFINAKLDLVELARHYGFEPRPDAGGRHKMCCPFHNEKTASFIIYPNNSYYCFGCAAAGRPVNFIMAQENKSFDEVIDMFKGDVDVQSTKFFTEVIVKKFDRSHFDLEKYKKNAQYNLGMYLRDKIYANPELKDKVFECYKEMDVFFNNSTIEDSKYVDEFVDSILEKV